MHYDGNDTHCAFQTGMYYYIPRNKTMHNYIEIRDRDGGLVDINDVSMYDSNGVEIMRYNPYTEEYHGGLTYVEIPECTKRIHVASDDFYTTAVICNNYESDSGSVCFVLMPNNNDKFRLWTFNGANSIFFIPHSHEIPKRYANVSCRKLVDHYGALELKRINSNSSIRE